jgi:hypothetical protein
MRTLQPAAVAEFLDGPHLLLQREAEECATRIMKFVERLP